jgi:hypothetical protein
MSPTYDRPQKATLYVRLESGETWEAKPEDLEKFNLVSRHEAYMTFDDAWSKILRRDDLVTGDITNALLNPVRYLVETAIAHPDLLDHEEHGEWQEVAECERLVAMALAGQYEDVREWLEANRADAETEARQATEDELRSG